MRDTVRHFSQLQLVGCWMLSDSPKSPTAPEQHQTQGSLCSMQNADLLFVFFIGFLKLEFLAVFWDHRRLNLLLWLCLRVWLRGNMTMMTNMISMSIFWLNPTIIRHLKTVKTMKGAQRRRVAPQRRLHQGSQKLNEGFATYPGWNCSCYQDNPAGQLEKKCGGGIINTRLDLLSPHLTAATSETHMRQPIR